MPYSDVARALVIRMDATRALCDAMLLEHSLSAPTRAALLALKGALDSNG